MRLLIVGMTNSVHTARWVRQLAQTDWEVYLFATFLEPPNPLLGDFKYSTCLLPELRRGSGTRIISLLPFRRGRLFLEYCITRLIKKWPWRQRWLELVIRRIKPDIVHSIELQHAGYLCLGARKRLGDGFPTWIATNWGSDVYLFGRLLEHKERVGEILRLANYYSAECQRDVALAKQHGFKGKIFTVVPNAGGFDLARIGSLGAKQPTSQRELILVKGYQHFSGRALVALEAIRMCADKLTKYKIRVYGAHPDVRIAAELLAQDTGLDIESLPFIAEHDEMLRLHGAARISIGLGISDGISTSFLEALVMGSFPIQSCTACADEWIEDGLSGFIVPPGDPALIADRIARAAQDDELVDLAARLNAQTVQERLEGSRITEQVLRAYEEACCATSAKGR